MKIIVTDCAKHFNQHHPILEHYKDNVVVLCTNPKTKTNYKCVYLPLPYNKSESIQSYIDRCLLEKYNFLYDINTDQTNTINTHDVFILIDDSIESHIPFYLFQNYNNTIIHLCCDNHFFQVPFSLDLFHHNLHIITLTVIEYHQINKELFDHLFYEIMYTLDRSQKYVYLHEKKCFINIFTLEPQQTIARPIKTNSFRCFYNKDLSILHEYIWEGICLPHHFYDSYSRIFTQPIRYDSKEICMHRKKMLKMIADANHISYIPSQCHFDGLCSGTCQKCETDLKYIEKTLQKIPESKRIYPYYNMKEGVDTYDEGCNL